MYQDICFSCFIELIFFVFFKGDGFQSDIALDEISLAQGGTCEYFASTTTSTSGPPTTAYDCGFEDGTLCDWQSETSDKPWTVTSGQTAVDGQAPLSDQTKQNVFGKYAYVPIEPTDGPVDYSTIAFRSLPRGSRFCLNFWYQAFVSSDTTLNV
jgi:hypothetical protein